jgi:hypothetical protein
VTNKPAPSGNAGFFHPLPEERVRAGIKRQQFRRRRSRRSGRTVVGGDACTPFARVPMGTLRSPRRHGARSRRRQVAILNRETAQGADRRIAEEIRVLIRATGARETRRSMMTQQGRAALARFSCRWLHFWLHGPKLARPFQACTQINGLESLVRMRGLEPPRSCPH